MKTFLILMAVLGVLFIIFQSFISASTIRTEKQAYQVVRRFTGFEVRHYPSVVMATTHAAAEDYRGLARTGFRRIAGYIFGYNESNKKIAMTAPVHMEITEQGSSMSFVMPSGYDLSNLPKPGDPKVLLEKKEDTYWAALSFGGFANDRVIAKQVARLKQLLKQEGIKEAGNYRYLGYNPPYQLIARRNEVAIPVYWEIQ